MTQAEVATQSGSFSFASRYLLSDVLLICLLVCVVYHLFSHTRSDAVWVQGPSSPQ